MKKEEMKVLKELVSKCNNVELKRVRNSFKQFNLNEYVETINEEMIKRGII